MDAKAKIAEMLKRKREGAERAAAAPPVAPATPAQSEPQQQNDQHGSARDRIAEMLKKRQETRVNVLPQQRQAPPEPLPAPPQREPVRSEPRVVERRTPYGLCLCCPQPCAIAARDDYTLYCPGSNRAYEVKPGGGFQIKVEQLDLPAANSIEAALNDGNAAFFYGGFIVGQEQETRRRRRRR